MPVGGRRGAAVSVVMPNFNHGRFLGEALEAVLAQEPAPFEVLLIDDASTDDSLAVAERFVRRNPNLRLIRIDLQGPLVLFDGVVAASEPIEYPSALMVQLGVFGAA